MVLQGHLGHKSIDFLKHSRFGLGQLRHKVLSPIDCEWLLWYLNSSELLFLPFPLKKGLLLLGATHSHFSSLQWKIRGAPSSPDNTTVQ